MGNSIAQSSKTVLFSHISRYCNRDPTKTQLLTVLEDSDHQQGTVTQPTPWLDRKQRNNAPVPRCIASMVLSYAVPDAQPCDCVNCFESESSSPHESSLKTCSQKYAPRSVPHYSPR